MKTDKTTVFDLFQTHRRYVVPLFQRGYVWSRDSQWEPLWNDLVSQAAELARMRTIANSRLQKHFLGALVLNLTHTALSQVPVVEVIDGQQRLTTLQILLAALKDETASIEMPYLRADLERLTKNQGPLANADEVYKVWPTSSLQIHVRNVMRAGSATELEDSYKDLHKFRYRKWDPPRPTLVEAYLFFASAIRSYLDDDDEALPLDLMNLSVKERAEALIEALLRNIQLVTIELDSEDDAQVIFETLNARGEPLTPSDLVRNFVFLTATRERQDVSLLYNDLWKPFEEEPPERPFWKQEERQGRLKRARMDLFLFHYVTFRTGEELKIGRLYQAFRDWWELAPNRVIEKELRELGRYSTVYRELLAPNVASRFGRFAHHLRVLDTTTVYPLVLWLAGEMGAESPEFLSVLDAFESYFVRRAVCGHNQKAYNRLFLGFLKGLREAASPPTYAAVQALLAASMAESAIWPGDNEFRHHLVKDPIYRTIGPRRTQMLLETLELASQHVHAEAIEIRSALTVEHVLPQGANAVDWPPEVQPGETVDDAQSRRATIVHSLGNLTLLTQPFNSALSNGPYDQKRPEIARQSLMALNTYFQDVKHWSESEIASRGAKLADLAVEIWPKPKPPPT